MLGSETEIFIAVLASLFIRFVKIGSLMGLDKATFRWLKVSKGAGLGVGWVGGRVQAVFRIAFEGDA